MVKTRTALVVTSLVGALLAACASGGSAASATPPAAADLEVDAEDVKFSTATITLKAGEASTVFFRNLDGMPHNIAIYTDDSASEPLFVGDMVTGAAITYEIPALEPGEYFFRCDAHPQMTGTVVVEAVG